VYTDNLNAGVAVMKSAQDGVFAEPGEKPAHPYLGIDAF
jgi:hypothetical protein